MLTIIWSFLLLSIVIFNVCFVSAEESVAAGQSDFDVFFTRDKGYNYSANAQVFRESLLVKALVGDGNGIEIGAGACNPFGVSTVHVGLTEEMDPEDFRNHREGQIQNCGDYARIDVPGDATHLPLFDSSVDFVLSSHVWEHVPNPLKALDEWARVVRDGGTIIAIVPLRNAHWWDVHRPITTLSQLLEYYRTNPSIDDFPDTVEHRGHCIVFSIDLLLQIMLWFNTHNHSRGVTLTLRAFLERDDKIGNGHFIAWKVNKQDKRDSKEVATVLF